MPINGDVVAGDVVAGARDTVNDMQDRMADSMEGIRGYADAADSSVRDFARERPLFALGCALALGFFIGRIASKF